MEIERKFLVHSLPENLEQYDKVHMEQAYLCTSPVLRIRRENDSYVFTYKGAGMMEREEYNLPLTKEAYEHLLPKTDGIRITKTRYRIPEKDGLTIELDIFSGIYEGLVIAEVEFPTKEAADAYLPPHWFAKDVSFDGRYHNNALSRGVDLAEII